MDGHTRPQDHTRQHDPDQIVQPETTALEETAPPKGVEEAPPPRAHDGSGEVECRDAECPRQLRPDAPVNPVEPPPRQGFWGSLTETERAALLATAEEVAYPIGTVLWFEGQVADQALVIRSGSVRVSVKRGGRERILAFRGPGDIVGERAALLLRRRSATVVAMDTVHGLRMTTQQFVTYLSDHPRVVAVMEREVYDRLTEPTAQSPYADTVHHDSAQGYTTSPQATVPSPAAQPHALTAVPNASAPPQPYGPPTMPPQVLSTTPNGVAAQPYAGSVPGDVRQAHWVTTSMQHQGYTTAADVEAQIHAAAPQPYGAPAQHPAEEQVHAGPIQPYTDPVQPYAISAQPQALFAEDEQPHAGPTQPYGSAAQTYTMSAQPSPTSAQPNGVPAQAYAAGMGALAYPQMAHPSAGGSAQPVQASGASWPVHPMAAGHARPTRPMSPPGPAAWAGQNCTIVYTDIAGFSAAHRNDGDRLDMRRVMHAVLRAAFEESGVPWESCHVEDRGDGALIVVPPEVPTAVVVDPVLTALAVRLRHHNRRSSGVVRIQLRVAVDVGPVMLDPPGVTGFVLIHTARLLDARPLKDRLAVTGADLGFIVSQFVYESFIAQGAGYVNPAEYEPISCRVKKDKTEGWIHLRGVPARSAV